MMMTHVGAVLAIGFGFATLVWYGTHGTDYLNPQISNENAWDIAAYVLSHPRPHLSGLEHDFPDLAKKPLDAPYGPYADHFSERGTSSCPRAFGRVRLLASKDES